MLDSQIASDYLKIQQALVRENGADNNNIQVRSQSEDSLPRTSSRQDQHRPPFSPDNQQRQHQQHQPPTPNRSRSSSVEISNNKSNSSNSFAAYPSRHGRPMPNQKASFTTPPSSGTASPAPNYSSRLSSIPSANSSAASLTQSPSSDSIYGLNDAGALPKGNLFSDTTTLKPDPSQTDVPSLNLSFFDNDSSDLLNLTKSLGANLAVDINNKSSSEQQQQQQQRRQLKTKPSKSLASGASAKFSKATELLSSSLRQATLGSSSNNSTWNDFPQPPTRGLKSSTSMLSLRSVDSSSSEKNLSNDKPSVSKLQADLKASNAKVSELSTNFNKIKVRKTMKHPPHSIPNTDNIIYRKQAREL